ncbi:MAG: DMP19 family protein [Gemmataceae bacterium]
MIVYLGYGSACPAPFDLGGSTAEIANTIRGGWSKTMPVPNNLLQAAFETLSEPTLRDSAKHCRIRGHKTLPTLELAQRLGQDDGTHLISCSHGFTESELEEIAKVFGLDHRRESRDELWYSVYTFIKDYDRNQKMGKVVTLEDALNRPNDYEQFRAVRELIERKLVKPSGYDLLCLGEKLLWAIQLLMWEVNNGGFDQYITNSSGDLAQETIGYLKLIEAKSTGKLLEEVANIFPNGVIPDDREKRCQSFSKWKNKAPKKASSLLKKLDDAFFAWTEDLTHLTLAYIRTHREDFD